MASANKAIPQPMVPRMAPREELNPYRISQIQFDMAAEFLKLDPGLRQILRTPRASWKSPVPSSSTTARSRFLRLSRAAQHRPRPVQGRHPLPSRTHARRSQSPGAWMTWKTRHGQHSLRRRQGRRHLRSQAHDPRRAGAPDAALSPPRFFPSSGRNATSPRPTSTPTRRPWPG